MTFKNILRFIDRHGEEMLAGAALLVMAVLVFFQVIMRYVFSAPFSWSDEIAVYCMVWSVYLSASWAVRERAHIRVVFFLTKLPRSLAKLIMFIGDLIWVVVAAFITWQGIILHQSLWKNPYHSPVLAIDQKWPYLVIAVCFGLMVLRLVQIYYKGIFQGQPIHPELDGSHQEEFHP